MRILSILALLAIPVTLFVALLPRSEAQAVPIGPGIKTPIVREPTLIHDVTGSTLIGPFHQNLVVYNDGLVSFAAASQIIGGGGDGQACTAFIPASEVAELTKALADAGAATLPDRFAFVADLPLTTVTFMKPATDTKAHTFSFFFGPGGYQQVQTIVNTFIQKHFPGGCSSSSIVK